MSPLIDRTRHLREARPFPVPFGTRLRVPWGFFISCRIQSRLAEVERRDPGPDPAGAPF
jgi:hypothetical protein